MQVDGPDEDFNEVCDDFGCRASYVHFESSLIHDPYFDVGHCWRVSIAVVTLDKNLWARAIHGTEPQRYFVKVFQYMYTLNFDGSVLFCFSQSANQVTHQISFTGADQPQESCVHLCVSGQILMLLCIFLPGDNLRVIFLPTMSCYYSGHYTRNISERCYYSTHYAVTLKVLAKMPSHRLCADLLFLDSLATLWATHFCFIAAFHWVS